MSAPGKKNVHGTLHIWPHHLTGHGPWPVTWEAVLKNGFSTLMSSNSVGNQVRVKVPTVTSHQTQRHRDIVQKRDERRFKLKLCEAGGRGHILMARRGRTGLAKVGLTTCAVLQSECPHCNRQQHGITRAHVYKKSQRGSLRALPPSHWLRWPSQNNMLQAWCWLRAKTFSKHVEMLT